MEFDRQITFYKMHGSGNDFVLIYMDDYSHLIDLDMENWARQLCKRRFCIGADGLIFLTQKGISDRRASYKWHFYNSDGSRAEMCGNGSRCAARLAFKLALAPQKHFFETDAGLIEAEVFDKEKIVKVQLTKPKDIQKEIDIELNEQIYKVHFVNTGVPHAVLFFENVNDVDVHFLGSKIRFHEKFQPDGTNVNFVTITPEGSLYLRTYERGVEAETYACGTGAAASAYMANKLGYIQKKDIPVITSGGEKLLISIEKEDTLYLTGGATIVYEGKLNLTEIGL